MRAGRAHKGRVIKTNGLLILLTEYECSLALLFPRLMYIQMSSLYFYGAVQLRFDLRPLKTSSGHEREKLEAGYFV